MERNHNYVCIPHEEHVQSLYTYNVCKVHVGSGNARQLEASMQAWAKLCMAIANGRTCHNTNTYYAKRLARSRTGSISPSSTLTWLSLKAGLTGGKTRRNTLPGYLNCVKLGIFGMGRHHPYIFKAKLTCFGSNVAMYNVSSSLQE